MAGQTGDELIASRSSIVGKITVQDILNLVTQSDWNATSGAAEILNKPTGLITTLSEASSRTLALTDKDKNIENSASITITVPTNATVAFSVGTQIAFTKKFETLTFAAAGGVTINSVDSLLEMGRLNCAASLLKIDTDEWNLIGELT